MLRRLRLAAGLTQEQLADQADLSVRTISDMERDRIKRPFQRSVSRLASALGLEGAAAEEFTARARPLAKSADIGDLRAQPIPEGTGSRGRISASGLPELPGVTPPRQLPAAVPHFAGRSRELATLSRLLDEVGRQRASALVISVIGGMPGVGKTALAVHWAHQQAERFPDGQLYVNLRGFDPAGTPVGVAVVVRGFLDALGVPPARVPAGLEDQLALYRSRLSRTRTLVVLDNARDEGQVRPLLPGAAGCLALVTSRIQLTGLVALDGAVPLTLDLLTNGEAHDLLGRRLGTVRLTDERQAVEQLIERCARLPLALNVAAARAAMRPNVALSVLAQQLQHARHRLDTLSTGERAGDVRVVFSWSYQSLSPAAARLFRLLGLHPGPDIGVTAVASLAAIDPDQARHVLDELTRAHLLSEHLPGRYTLHDLLRAYAADLAHHHDSPNDRHEALHRVLDHHLHTTHTAFTLLYPARLSSETGTPRLGVSVDPLTDRDDALNWYRAERPGLLAMLTLAAEAGLDSYAWRILQGWGAFLDRRGHWQELVTLSEIALGAAQRSADQAGQAFAHRWLGDVLSRLGFHRAAHEHLRHALALYDALGDRSGQATIHHTIAMLFERQHQFVDALEHERLALEVYRADGYRAGQARALNAIGWFNAMFNRYAQALTYCEEALDLARQIHSPDIEATILDSLGYAHHHLGHHADAITHYKSALILFETAGERYYQAAILAHLGDTQHAVNDTAAAREAWQQALDILDDLQHPDADRMRAKLDKLKIGDTN